MTTLRSELAALAEASGFERFGVARAEPLGVEAERLGAWLAQGYHGSMRWMAEHRDVRADPTHRGMVSGARSVIVVATRYSRRPLPSSVDVKVAAYARGRDYHRVLEKRLRPLLTHLREAGFAARGAVDSKPVFERAWAVRAGLGFIGKNCCLIIPGLGSHVFLAAVVTTAKLSSDSPMPERCGSCTRCLDVCPTDAFVGSRQLDSRRCISYLTIEHSELPTQELRANLDGWAFGCDVCQDVCPFNQGAGARGEVPLEQSFFNADRWADFSAGSFLELDKEAFDSRFAGNPLRRAGSEQMARNVALALGSRGEGARRYLPVLEQTAQDHSCFSVRAAAEWATKAIAHG